MEKLNLPNDTLPNFSIGFVDKGVLNKDPTVWLDAAIPTNTCLLPRECANAAAQCTLYRDKTRVQMPAKIFPHLKLKW
jgi:hypothetical protein